MQFKLGYYPDIKNREILDSVNDGQEHLVMLTTNKLDPEFDKRDPRYISRLKEVKIVYKLEDKGCLILIGNLGCDFKPPIGGMFFCKRVYIDRSVEYDSIQGVNAFVQFSNYPISISEMQDYLLRLYKSEKFEFNLAQFDEFMDIFTFYKTLSSEPIYAYGSPKRRREQERSRKLI